MKKNDKKIDVYAVKTSGLEAVIVSVISVLVFLAAVFMTLLPYIGIHIYNAMH